MAAASIKLAILEGVRVVHRESDTLTPKFLQVGIGTITLSESGGALDLGGATLASVALTSGMIFVGNVSNLAVPVALSGHVTMTNAGVVTISNNAVDTPQLKDEAVVLGKLSPGLQTEISDHETRIGDAESEIIQLQNAVAAIQANTPQQDIQAGTGVAAYTVVGALTFDASNTVFDIDVYVDGRLQTQDETGTTLKSYKKTSTTALLFTEVVLAGKEIKIFKRGTSSGPAINYSTPVFDFENLTVAPAPAVNGDKSLGTTVKAFKSLFLKDKVTAQVYELEIVNGVVSFSPI